MNRRISLVLVMVLLGVILVACGSQAEVEPTSEALPGPLAELSATRTAIALLPPEPSATPMPDVAARPNCNNVSAYVQDVTVPDGTLFVENQPFVKTWRVRNDGDCTWGDGYSLVFSGGDAMTDNFSVPITQTTEPGNMIDLSVDLVSPAQPGKYRGEWKLESPYGEIFGEGPDDSGVWVQIEVGPEGTRTVPLGGSIAGTVYRDANGNSKFDPGEQGVPGASVSLHPNSSCDAINSEGITTTTDQDGGYSFKGLDQDTYCLVAASGTAYQDVRTVILGDMQDLTGIDLQWRAQ